MILGIDTGGTFTDFVLLPGNRGADLKTHKVLSTPEAPERAILQGITEMGLAGAVADGSLAIIHGSTVATNAALEGKGVRTAFVTNRGFRDLLTIARQTRPSLYRLETPPVPPPVEEALCLEVDGRVDANGLEIEPLHVASLEALVADLAQSRPEAVAVSLLFSFLNDSHEQTVGQALRNRLPWQPFLSLSSEVLPEYREYERSIATWLNATLGPLVQQYLLRLKAGTSPARLSVMQSSGGTISAEQASTKAVNLLLSGPAGGLAAASYIADITGIERLLTFDMGGTSTDVALLEGSEIGLTSEGRIGPYPVGVPMVDMHTIGAGGGSIAYLDKGGLLQVGPQSAGASPGPACYGQGGTLPTVTDANLLLGRIQPDAFMGGAIKLDVNAAGRALETIAGPLGLGVEDAAAGVIRIANEHMARALRVISVERGHDPARFRLCCFGGAGGLHICALAEAMNMKQAMVPVHAGVLSAMGMFLAPVERQLSQTHQCLLAEADETRLSELFSRLAEEGSRQLADEGIAQNQVETRFRADIRYAGQSTALTLPWESPDQAEAAFHAQHEHRYGHRLAVAVELVNLRVSVSQRGSRPEPTEIPAAGSESPAAMHKKRLYGVDGETPVFDRVTLGHGARITGPALIAESSATTYIASGWEVLVDRYGNLLLQRG